MYVEVLKISSSPVAQTLRSQHGWRWLRFVEQNTQARPVSENLADCQPLFSPILPLFCWCSTGLLGYFRRGLIDTASAVPFIIASLPACLLGAIIVPYADERVLKALYAVFMLGLSAYLLLDDQGWALLILI